MATQKYGSSRSESALTLKGCFSMSASIRKRRVSFELLEFLAHQAARAQQQDQGHEDEHGGFGCGRIEHYGDAAHDTDQKTGIDHPPETSQAANDIGRAACRARG